MSTGSYLARRAIYQNQRSDESAGGKAAAQQNGAEAKNGNPMPEKKEPEVGSRMDGDRTDGDADSASSI